MLCLLVLEHITTTVILLFEHFYVVITYRLYVNILMFLKTSRLKKEQIIKYTCIDYLYIYNQQLIIVDFLGTEDCKI